MRSPYTVLGVSKTAKADEIKSAYRQLAKTWHPDQNRDDPLAGSRFAEISLAYRLLIDPESRLQFDNGHIDARGRRRTRPVRGFAANPFKAFKQAMGATGGGGKASEKEPEPEEPSFEDMVSHIFGEAAARQTWQNAGRDTGAARRRPEAEAPGMDQDPLDALDALFTKWKTRHRQQSGLPLSHHHIEIDITAALTGDRAEIQFPDGQKVPFDVPAGMVDGGQITVPSPDPSTLGNALVTVRHRRHPHFYCLGADIHGEHSVDLTDAVLGGSFVFESLEGPLRMVIPEWSGSDAVLRVQEKGLPMANGKRGALLVHLRVMLPEKPDQRLIELVRTGRKPLYV